MLRVGIGILIAVLFGACGANEVNTCIPFGAHCKAGDVIYASGWGAASKCDYSKSIAPVKGPVVVCVYIGYERPNRTDEKAEK